MMRLRDYIIMEETRLEKIQWYLLGIGILFGIFIGVVVIVRFILENL